MDWLHPFIALSLCCGIVLTLLPQGSLRRTAALVLGLMLTICWAESLAGLFHFTTVSNVAASMLTPSGYTCPTGGE